jgi:hypothetical protein
MRIVKHDELNDAMLEYERGQDDRVPFTQDEMDAMSANPCEYGYHRFTPNADELADPDFMEHYEGLCCLDGCGYAIG